MREADWLKSNDHAQMLNRRSDSPRFDERKLRLFAVACCRRVWDILVDERSRVALEALERFLDGQESPGRLADALRAATEAETSFRWNPDLLPESAFWADGRYAPEATFHTDPTSGEYGPGRIGELWSAANAVLFAACRLEGGKDHGGFSFELHIMNAADSAAASRGFHEGNPETWAGLRIFQATNRAEKVVQADLLREILGNPYRPIAFEPGWRTPDVLALARAVDESGRFDALPILGDALEEAGCEHAEILTHCRRRGGHVRGCWALDLVIDRPGPFAVDFETGTPGDPPGIWRSVRRLLGFGRG